MSTHTKPRFELMAAIEVARQQLATADAAALAVYAAAFLPGRGVSWKDGHYYRSGIIRQFSGGSAGHAMVKVRCDLSSKEVWVGVWKIETVDE